MAVLNKSKMIDIAGDFNPIKKPADAAMKSVNQN